MSGRLRGGSGQPGLQDGSGWLRAA